MRGLAALACLFLIGCAGTQPGTAPGRGEQAFPVSDWSMEGGDPARTSASTHRAPSAWEANRIVTLKTDRGFEPEEYATPIVIEGVAYVGHSGRSFDAVRLVDGQILWRVKTRGRVYATAAYWEGLLVFGDDQGIVRAVTLQGEEVWQFPAQYPVVASPVAADGKVFVAVADQNVYCLEAATGRPIWQYGRRFPRYVGLWRSLGLCYGNDALYAGFSDGTVVALEPEVGRVLWRVELGEADVVGAISAGPVFDDRRVYVGTLGGPVACLDAADGKELWRHAGGVAVGFAVGAEHLYAGTAAGSLLALARLDGKPVWETELEGGLPTVPTLADGGVLLGTAKGSLYGLDALSGKMLGRYVPGPGLRSQPMVFAGGTLMLSNQGAIHWIR